MYEFVAIYKNSKNGLCTVLKDSDGFLIVTDNVKRREHSLLYCLLIVASDYKNMIEVNRNIFKVDDKSVEVIDEYCNCAHAFFKDLKRLGYGFA